MTWLSLMPAKPPSPTARLPRAVCGPTHPPCLQYHSACVSRINSRGNREKQHMHGMTSLLGLFGVIAAWLWQRRVYCMEAQVLSCVTDVAVLRYVEWRHTVGLYQCAEDCVGI